MKKIDFIGILLVFAVFLSCSICSASIGFSDNQPNMSAVVSEYMQTDIPRTNFIYVKSLTQSIYRKTNAHNVPSYTGYVPKCFDINYPESYNHIILLNDSVHIDRICSSYNPRAP